MRTIIFNCVSRHCLSGCYLGRTVLLFRQELLWSFPEIDLPARPYPTDCCLLTAPGCWDLTFLFLQTIIHLLFCIILQNSEDAVVCCDVIISHLNETSPSQNAGDSRFQQIHSVLKTCNFPMKKEQSLLDSKWTKWGIHSPKTIWKSCQNSIWFSDFFLVQLCGLDITYVPFINRVC